MESRLRKKIEFMRGRGVIPQPQMECNESLFSDPGVVRINSRYGIEPIDYYIKLGPWVDIKEATQWGVERIEWSVKSKIIEEMRK